MVYLTYTDFIEALNLSRVTPWLLTDWLRERVLEDEGEGGGTEAELLRLCLLLKVMVAVVSASVVDPSLTCWRVVEGLLELLLIEAAAAPPRVVSIRSVFANVDVDVDDVVDVVDVVVDTVVDAVVIGAVVMMVAPKIADWACGGCAEALRYWAMFKSLRSKPDFS